MDITQDSQQQFKGGLGQFQARYADIKSTYFEYEGETMEELEKKISKGVDKVENTIIMFIIIPIAFIAMAYVVKGLIHLFEEMQRQGK